MSPSCPSFEELSRSMGSPRSRRLSAHLAGCSSCRRTCAALAGLEDAARRLPAAEPDPNHSRRMEETIVALAPPQASSGRGRRVPTFLATGAAIAAGFALVVALLPAEERVPLRSLEVSEGAKYERITRHPAGDGGATLELVRLERGTVTLQVEHLDPKERFVVATSDAEVEVRGTLFEVDADGGLLRRVSVSEGKVEVRVKGEAPVLLLPGDQWVRSDASAPAVVDSVALAAAEDPPVVAAAVVEEPRAIGARKTRRRAAVPVAPSPLEPPAPEPVDVPAVPAPKFPAEEAFASGWAALRDGAARDAAASFAAASEAEGELGQDAAYWEIVALARAGESADAESRMTLFLERHRSSLRAGEVALMLGLRVAARGDRSGALAHLRKAATAADPRVRATAGEALDRLDDPDRLR